ncbi:MAG: hypothetical protein V9G04_05425 [Nocardioides sp.]|jgi:hypothetical protein
MVGLCVLLALIAGGISWRAADDHGDVDLPAPQLQESLSQSTVQALRGFARAVRTRDAQAAIRWGVPDSSTLPDLVDNATAAQVRGFALRLIETRTPRPNGNFSATVATTWAYAGFDKAMVRTELDARLRRTRDGVRLVGFGGGPAALPVWLAGPAQIRREGALLLVSQATPHATDALRTYARRAVPLVRRMLPDWPGRLVVEVPGRGGLAGALGAEPGTYDNIAAVTAAQDGSTAPDAPIHVFVNADVLGRLRPAGAQVVLSHEATHVATRAAGSALPSWAIEGFADYVALRDVDLPLTVTAGRIREVVRRDGLPEALPDAADFEPGAPDLEAAYESAWIAWRVLADALEDEKLVALYREADRSGSMETSLSAAGMPAGDLTARWRQALAELAS